MAIRDRLAKALRLPAGATTQSEQQIVALSQGSGTTANPLPREPELATTPFPPAMPLIPSLINRPRDDGRADPRKYEFPVAWNIQITEQRDIPFRVLREVADMADIVRKCIEVNKAIISGMDWDITINEDAVTRVMAENGLGSTAAAKLVREKYAAEITAAKDFWRMPDRMNGMSFQEWLMMALEEVLVVDALSIYPNKTLDNKNLHSLEILDGTTIKPLLNAHGSRPIPPHPAFQQILWGFPRGEFTASADADGEFTADDLIYVPRNRRSFTPYGFSPVERALPLVDLYMKRLQWFRTEFTDGVIPDLAVMTDIEFGTNPQLITAYEQVMNDQLAGNLEQRRRARLFPKGFKPEALLQADSKYSDVFDNFLIKSICGHFGVLPTQIGFTPQSGLGGKGHQDGEASSAEAIGIKPLVAWVEDLLNQLSHRFLGMPRDLAFVFSESTAEDEMAQATRRQTELFSGQKTWNEIRSEAGQPLFTFPEADSPLIVQGGQIVPLAATFEAVSFQADEQDQGTIDDNPDMEAGKAELETFIKWAKTTKPRDFQFTHIDDDLAEVLNRLAKEDTKAARDYAWHLHKAGGVRPKVRAGEPFPKNHPARARAEQLVRIYKKKFASLGNVDTSKVADAWLASSHSDPMLFLREQNIKPFKADAVKMLTNLYWEAGWMGKQSGQVLVARARKRVKADNLENADWAGWIPGNPAKAEKLLGEEGTGAGLQQILDRAGVTISGITDTRLQMMGRVLANASKNGLGVKETAKALSDVVDDPFRAEMIAATEMSRANTAAQLDSYRENGASMVDWQTADDNACEECKAQEEGSPYPINAAPEPPEHPYCGCQLIPSAFDSEEPTMNDDIELAAEPELVKVKRKAIDVAIDKLDEIPDAKGMEGYIDVPWKSVPRPKVEHDLWGDAPLKSFEIEKLVATQLYVQRKNVEWHLKHLNDSAHDNKSLPNILVDNGRNLIYDGHHRLTAYWLLGADWANCWTLEN
jgi:SPP1 gp7 family putative phage head morphogenesis protein